MNIQLAERLIKENGHLAAENRELRDALTYVRNELDRWGYGDFRYGETPREASVVTALEIADAALNPTAIPNESEIWL